MATLTGISIGSTVAVNAHGVKYVTTDATETTRISEEGNVIYEIADFLKVVVASRWWTSACTRRRLRCASTTTPWQDVRSGCAWTRS
jgi:hypothetical protein